MIKTDFEEYVEKYCRKHGISKEDAEQHAIVKAYKEECQKREEENGD